MERPGEQLAWEQRWKGRSRQALELSDPIDRDAYTTLLIQELVERFRKELIRPWLYSMPEEIRLEVAMKLMESILGHFESLALSPRSLRAELRRISLLTAVSVDDERALETLRHIA